MSQIQKKFLKADSVDESKILLLNDGALRARNAADTADVEIMKLDASDVFKMLKLPRISSVEVPTDAKDLVTKEYADSALSSGVTSLLGQPDGIATLDMNGKVPVSQLPNSIMQYQGTFSAIFAAASNQFQDGEVNGDEQIGDVYRCAIAGTLNAGSGPLTFKVGDYIILNADKIWERAETADLDPQIAELRTDLNQEVSDRELLQTRFDQEIIDRIADVDAEESRALAAEGVIAGNLAQEILDRVADVDAEESRALAAEGVIAGNLAQEILDRVADVNAEESRALAAEGVISGNLAQEILDRVADVDAEESRALAAEGLLDGRATALEGRATALEAKSLEWQPVEKFTLTAPMISAGYVELSFLAVEHSIMASVDRLMIHHTDDYTVSVVGGKTRLTFVGSLVTNGQEKLAVGDVIRVQACKVAII